VIVSNTFCNKHKLLEEKGWTWEEIQMTIQIVMKRYVERLVIGELRLYHHSRKKTNSIHQVRMTC
jgi:hypothetical protein